MAYWIRAAARAIRTERESKFARIAAQRDVTESTVRRFEKGETVQINVDSMIAAYSEVTDVPVIEFWRRAVEMWQANGR